MSTVIRAVPWVLSTALAATLGFTWLSMDAQLERKTQELSDLQDRYKKVIAEANLKLEEASQRNAKLVATANEQIRLANMREVDVRVGFRKALLSSGQVAGVTNSSGGTIAIGIEIARSSSGAKRNYEFTLDAGQNAEIGEREGWAFISGDTLSVSQAERKTLVFTVP